MLIFPGMKGDNNITSTFAIIQEIKASGKLAHRLHAIYFSFLLLRLIKVNFKYLFAQQYH